jgi:uncharacterized membrane protein
VRAGIVSALAGHWIANAFADPGEYAAVGLRYEGAALRPILIQVVVVALIVGALTLASRYSTRRSRLHPSVIDSRAVVTAILATLQLAAFAVMEITERLALGESYGAAIRSGIFDRSFAVELVVAIVTALVVVAIAMAVRSVVRSILSGPRTGRRLVAPSRPWESPWVGNVLILAGAGGVRAPPQHTRYP